MVRDNRRFTAPDNCLPPHVFEETKKEKNLENNQSVRDDGRASESLKSISLQVGTVPFVSGSAYLECGKTKIVCSVNGPRDILNKSESSSKGQVFCEFKFSSFSCKERQSYLPTEKEYSISKSIQEALEPVILLHKFPKSRLDISILVLENDGGAVSCSITCAGAALSNAGVEMYDLPIGCSLVYYKSNIVVNPTAKEENFCKEDENSAEVSLAMMVEYKSQVVYLQSSNCISQELLKECLKVLQSSCQEILYNIRECLKKHVKEMHESETDKNEKALCKMMGTQLKLFQPQKYIATHLEHDIRPSGRLLDEFRPVLLNIGSISTADGSALVRIGDTSVLCGIKAELTNPLPKEPNQGFFIPNVTLTPICSNRYVPGPPTEEAQVYSQLIMDLWKNSMFVDPKDLCLAEGQLCWCLFAEIVCLSCDGNILDACILSLMTALKNTKLPKVEINSETGKIEVKDSRVDLRLHNSVFSTTFAIIGENALADPSSEEESLEDSSITIFLKNDQSLSLHSFGPVSENHVYRCINNAKKRWAELAENLVAINK